MGMNPDYMMGGRKSAMDETKRINIDVGGCPCCGGAIRGMCHSDRWRAPPDDKKAQVWLDKYSPRINAVVGGGG